MSGWMTVLKKLEGIISQRRPHDLLFRGHADAKWSLIPTAGRNDIQPIKENRLYNKFVQRGAHLLPPVNNSWEMLFLMQHHGLPTRLLDWTETFAVALYFALRDIKSGKDAAIWTLDPYALNQELYGLPMICNPYNDLEHGYEDYFDVSRQEKRKEFPADAIAIFSTPYHSRTRSQQAYFTIHKDISQPLELQRPEVLQQLIIPYSCFQEARKFLAHAGINEFSLFPDADGLARQIKQEELGTSLLYRTNREEIVVKIRRFQPDTSVSQNIMSKLIYEGIHVRFFQA